MFTTSIHRGTPSYRRTLIHSGTAIAAATLMLAGVIPASAACPDPETLPRSSRTATVSACLLERIGTQFVLCDNLTGNGVRAPSWIPEQAGTRAP